MISSAYSLLLLLLFNTIPNGIIKLDETIQKSDIIYSKVNSASGRISREIKYSNNKLEYYGRFFIQSKKGLFIEYTEPEHLIFTLKEKEVAVYSEDNNRQNIINLNKKNISDFSTMSFLNLFFPNILNLCKDNYFIFLMDTTQDSRILRLENTISNSGSSDILLKISKKNNKFEAVEIFNSNSELVYQLIYEKYENFGGILFPVKLSIKFIQANQLYSEEVSFHRISVNEKIPEKYLNFKPPENTIIDTLKFGIEKH